MITEPLAPIKPKLRMSAPPTPTPNKRQAPQKLVEYWGEKSQKFWYYNNKGEETHIFHDPQKEFIGWQINDLPDAEDCDRLIDIALQKFGEPLDIRGEFDFVQRVSARAMARGVKVMNCEKYDPPQNKNEEDEDEDEENNVDKSTPTQKMR